MPEYQSLYRKYRSQTFADLVGQDASSRALQGAITSGRVAHAYLFSGSRGTGKTSAARLLAKALNCTGRPRDSAEPCNKCQSCVEVIAGSALDLIEIDAASNRGIDEIRDLREKVNLSPALGPYKVYHRRGAHAHRAGVQRLAQDTRRAARARRVRAVHDRCAEDPADGDRPLPAIRVSAAQRGADHFAAYAHR